MRLSLLFEDKLPKNAVTIPVIKQQTKYSCGAVSAMSVLRYFKLFDGKEKDLYKPLKTKATTGTTPKNIVKVLNDYGLDSRFEADVSFKDLKNWLSPTQVAIIAIQAWENEKDPLPLSKSMNDGHYVVFIGFDDKDVYFMDPSMGKKYGSIPVKDFTSRWHSTDVDGKRQEHQTIFIKGKDPSKAKPKETDAEVIK